MKLQSCRSRIIIIVILAVALLASGALYWLVFRKSADDNNVTRTENAQSSTKQTPPIKKPSITIAAMGDMLAHDSVVMQARQSDGYDFKPYFSSIKPLYQNADVVFCNPETPSAGEKFGVSGYPTFNAPTEFARDLHQSGCNLINLATNHMVDKGQPALDETIAVWEAKKPLAVAGANRSADEQQQVRYFEKNGIKVGFVAFADFSNAAIPAPYSVNLYRDDALVTKLLEEARRQADVVIVSAHWGDEDSHTINTNQRQAAQRFADLGADVVIGTGPHVVQPVSWIDGVGGKKTLVWYSIGNMLSTQLGVDQLTGGVAKFTVSKQDQSIVVSDINFSGTFMSYQWSAADKVAMNLSKRYDLKLQPLASAESETVMFGVSVDERASKLRQWLGTDAKLTITP